MQKIDISSLAIFGHEIPNSKNQDDLLGTVNFIQTESLKFGQILMAEVLKNELFARRFRP